MVPREGAERASGWGRTPAGSGYQHSTGTTLEESLRAGFDQWARVDLPVLLDAAGLTPKQCTFLTMTHPPAQGGHTRVVILGPLWGVRPSGLPPSTDDEHGPGCACCFFSRSSEALKPLLQSSRFAALRFFAARSDEGVSADCRMNGEDFNDCLPLLKDYAAQWPGRNFEFRKQYVIIRDQFPCEDTAGPPAPGA